MIDIEAAKKYCKDDISLIENYEKALEDTTQTWHMHHRRESVLTKKELIDIGEYWHRPACELIFLTKAEHKALHNKFKSWFKGHKMTDEQKRRVSEGTRRAMNTPEMRAKMLAIRAKISEGNKGMMWWNNGAINKRSRTQPEGFVHGRIKCNQRLT